jgi:transcriptional regulator with XRE-family HTH domain
MAHHTATPTGKGDAISRAIRTIRKRVAVTQTEFARRTGWAQSLISQYETGRTKPGPQRIYLLLSMAKTSNEITALTDLVRGMGLPLCSTSIPQNAAEGTR